MADTNGNAPAAAATAKAKKPTPAKAVTVRALRAHTQPGTQTYRAEGEEFVHRGEVYKHVEEVKAKPVAEDEEPEQ